MYDETKSEFKSVLTMVTGGTELPLVHDLGAAFLANYIGPMAADLVKAEQAGGFGDIFRDTREYPFFAVCEEMLRDLSSTLIEFWQSCENHFGEMLRSDELATYLETAGKTAKNSVVALLLRFSAWVARSIAKWLQRRYPDERQPTATEAKIGVLLAEVRTASGPENLKFDRLPFRAVVTSLAAEGRPFMAAMAFEHLREQIELYREALAGRSFPQLAKEANLASSTVRKLFSSRLSTRVTVGTLARVSAALGVPLLGVRPTTEAETGNRETEPTQVAEPSEIPNATIRPAADLVEELCNFDLAAAFATRSAADPVEEPGNPAEAFATRSAANLVEELDPAANLVEEPGSLDPADPAPVIRFCTQDVAEHFKVRYVGKLDPLEKRAAILRLRVHEYISTNQALSSPDYSLDSEDPAMIAETLRHYRRYNGQHPWDMPAIVMEDAHKYIVARSLWTDFQEWTGIDRSLSARSMGRLIDAVDIAFAELHSQESTTIGLQSFGEDATGPKSLDALLTRKDVEELTGIDTLQWPSVTQPKIRPWPSPSGLRQKVARSIVDDPAMQAAFEQLRKQLDSLTAKVNSHLTH